MTYRIIVNGRDKHVEATELGYTDLVLLADKLNADSLQKGVLTITYSVWRRGDARRSGTIVPGKRVMVEEGMVFNVADTSNA